MKEKTILKHFQNNQIDKILDLLDDEIDLDFRDRDGFTFLMLATTANDEKIVDRLLFLGSDVNAVNDEINHALYMSVAHKDNVLTRKLIEHKSSLVNENRLLHTVFDWALEVDNLGAIKLLASGLESVRDCHYCLKSINKITRQHMFLEETKQAIRNRLFTFKLEKDLTDKEVVKKLKL